MKRLKNLQDVRRFLARVANDLDSDKISEGKARTLAYVCSILNQVIKDGEIEQRLEAVERALEMQKD